MSNTTVKMEVSSISTSLSCRPFSFIWNQRPWRSVHINSKKQSPTCEDKAVLMRVMSREACIDVSGMQGMSTNSCQTIVYRQQETRSSLTFSDRRSWDSAAHCFLTTMCRNEDVKPQAVTSRPGCVRTNTYIKIDECMEMTISLLGLSYNKDLD